MKLKHLEATEKGAMDYDLENDILFLKVAGRTYARSVELDDIVVDLDQEGAVIGVQVFDVSALFALDKAVLQHVQQWQFSVKIEQNVITIQIFLEFHANGKVVERMQNLVRESPLASENSEVVCALMV